MVDSEVEKEEFTSGKIFIPKIPIIQPKIVKRTNIGIKKEVGIGNKLEKSQIQQK